MKNLVGLFLFVILAILQSTIISRMPLLNGSADVVLLFIIAWALQDRVESAWQWCIMGGLIISFYSALPFGIYIASYLIATGIARLLKRRVWKAPYLAMLAATFIGSIIVLLISMLTRIIMGVNFAFLEVVNIIILPGLLLNLLLAVPVFSIMHDMAGWLYPEVLEA